jgi:hypothetical protein
MNRQIVIRVLLSLLLLLTQQMAMAHAMSHLAGQIDGAAAAHQVDDGDLTSAFAKDQSCNQCLGFAQLATPVASDMRSFAAIDPVSAAVAVHAEQALCERTFCVFQSRAPPQA